MHAPATDIAQRIEQVRARIRDAAAASGRPADAITLVAVSKTRSGDEVEAALAAGVTDIGENYLQEALDKRGTIRTPAHWHFIGACQSNKTRQIAEHFDWVHTVDRSKIARRLSEQRPDGHPPLQVCIEVNVDAESSKAGLAPAEVTALAREIVQLPRLRLRGLMAIPRSRPDADATARRAPFRALRELLETVRSELAGHGHDTTDLDVLSMGMSDDLEAAVAEGATHVRIGTAIFGPRPQRDEQVA